MVTNITRDRMSLALAPSQDKHLCFSLVYTSVAIHQFPSPFQKVTLSTMPLKTSSDLHFRDNITCALLLISLLCLENDFFKKVFCEGETR